MADEVDFRPGVGVVRQMGGELLPVLAAHGDARGDGGANGVAGLHLGGGAEGDLAGSRPASRAAASMRARTA